jgi:hypothetical protein
VLWQQVTGARYVSYGQPVLNSAVSQSPQWRQFADRILAVAIADCPVGKEAGDDGQPRTSKHLRDTMERRLIFGETPMILIGSTLTRGGGSSSDVSALGLLVAPSGGPYPIEPKDPDGVLRWFKDGAPVFRKYVKSHPPPKKNDFVTRAMQAVCLESGGGV